MSPEIAASTRGSSWAASATTNVQPGSAIDRAAHLLRQLQRSPAVGRPAAGDDAAGHVGRAEAAVVHPLVEPVPAVGGEQAGELLVLQQRLDDRVLDLFELPRAGRGDLQARALQALEQLDGRVGVEGRVVDRGAHLRRAPPPSARDARRAPGAGPSTLGQDLLVLGGVPRQAGELHLGGGQRADALGGEQQVELAGHGGGLDRDPLPPQLGDRVGVGGRGLEVEERVRRVWRAPAPAHPTRRPGQRGERGPRRRRRRAQDAAAEPQVEGAFDAGAGLRAAADTSAPCRSTPSAASRGSRSATQAGSSDGPHHAHPRALSGLVQLGRHHPVGDGAESDEHSPSITSPSTGRRDAFARACAVRSMRAGEGPLRGQIAGVECPTASSDSTPSKMLPSAAAQLVAGRCLIHRRERPATWRGARARRSASAAGSSTVAAHRLRAVTRAAA